MNHAETLLLRYLAASNYSLDSGAPYQWACYPHARFYDCMTPHGTASFVADVRNGVVYEVHVVREETPLTRLQLDTLAKREENRVDVGYRWINPDFRPVYLAECEEHRVPDSDIDGHSRYHDTDCVDDILSKVEQILQDLPLDHTVVMQFDLPEDVLALLDARAAQEGITRDDLIRRILQWAVDHPEQLAD